MRGRAGFFLLSPFLALSPLSLLLLVQSWHLVSRTLLRLMKDSSRRIIYSLMADWRFFLCEVVWDIAKANGLSQEKKASIRFALLLEHIFAWKEPLSRKLDNSTEPSGLEKIFASSLGVRVGTENAGIPDNSCLRLCVSEAAQGRSRSTLLRKDTSQLERCLPLRKEEKEQRAGKLMRRHTSSYPYLAR